MDLSYIINELGEDREHYYNAIAPPIMQTSNFAFDTVADMRKAFEDEFSTYIYSRGQNPTVEILRKKLAALDKAEDCLVFNCGAAAIFTAVLANVKAGDHIISVREPYSWAKNMFNIILPRFGVTTTYVDGRELKNFEDAIQPNTTVIYLETPNSWDYAIQDLRGITALVKPLNIITICDNSYSTPLYQSPIELGIDLSLQSATKYIGGHSDTVAGVLSGSHEMIKKIFLSEYLNIGSGIQPFNAWLLLRGLRTLPIRLERISATSEKVLQFLKGHSLVENVLFPLDKDFPQYKLAASQMNGACGLITFGLKVDSVAKIEKFCDSLKHIRMAVSWGGHESLVIPKCAGMKREDFNPADPSHKMIRLYCGLEDPGYIISDLEQAVDRINK